MLYSLLAFAACTPGDRDPGGGDVGSGDTDSAGAEGQDSGELEVDESELDANLESDAGDFAYDFLQGAQYDRVVVEVDYVAGREPDDDALDALASNLESFCDKPGGVQVIVDDEIPDQGAPAWSLDAAEALEVAWRNRYRSAAEGTAVLYYLYIDGHSEDDGDEAFILGYAYHGSSLVLFKDRIDEAAGTLGLLGSVEDTVVVHELGHVLGLVDNGIPMVTDHRDDAHGRHDTNESCVMYWAAETDAVTELLGSGTPDFDEACRADMTAAGGR